MKYGPIEEIVLLGGGELLRSICLWAKSEGAPIKVVTSPRHAEERVGKVILREFLADNRIDFLEVDEFEHDLVKGFLGDTGKSFCLSLGAAWIFRKKQLTEYFNGMLFNLHGTRLPQNRGGGGFSWQIMMGNRLGFCVLHRIDGSIDTGEIVAFDEFLYPPALRTPSDYARIYNEQNLNFIIDFVERYRSSNRHLRLFPQMEYFSTYWPRLNTALNGWIDWSTSPAEIERFICAFDSPYVGASTKIGDRVVRLKNVFLNPQEDNFHPFQSGLIYRKSKHWFCVALPGSSLIIQAIRDKDGNNIFDAIKIGDRLHTPEEMLNSANDRPIYTPSGKMRVSNG